MTIVTLLVRLSPGQRGPASERAYIQIRRHLRRRPSGSFFAGLRESEHVTDTRAFRALRN